MSFLRDQVYLRVSFEVQLCWLSSRGNKDAKEEIYKWRDIYTSNSVLKSSSPVQFYQKRSSLFNGFIWSSIVLIEFKW